MTRPGDTIVVQLPDEPDSAGRARELADRLRGDSRERVDDAGLLLHELVAATLYEGVDTIEVRVAVRDGCLRLEVVAPGRRHRGHHRGARSPAAELGSQLIGDLSDRSGDDGTTIWCELDGSWTIEAHDGRGRGGGGRRTGALVTMPLAGTSGW